MWEVNVMAWVEYVIQVIIIVVVLFVLWNDIPVSKKDWECI